MASSELKKMILPAQSSGFSLSDFIQAYLDNAKQIDLYTHKDLKALFGEMLFKVEMPIYKSGFYRYEMLTLAGPKHVEKIELSPKLIAEVFNKSCHAFRFPQTLHLFRPCTLE
jgi:hypothetical protein